MHNRRIFGSLALLLTALIWGFAFVAQSMGMDSMPPMMFNAARSFVGMAGLAAFLPFLDMLSGGRTGGLWGGCTSRKQKGTLLVGGLCCGVALGIASMLQQIGIVSTTVGKAGFITSLYIVMVPIAGMFLGRKCGVVIWACALLALYGAYLLCGESINGLGKGDCLIFASAIGFTIHILVIDHFAPITDCVRMSCIQFFIAGCLSLACGAASGESLAWQGIRQATLSILFCGLFSSAIGYTLQIVGQKYVPPVIATLLMSLESVFSVIGG